MNLSSKSIAMLTLAGRDGRIEPGATIAFAKGSMGPGPDHGPARALRLGPARFVGPDGEPVAAQVAPRPRLSMVITPGPPSSRARQSPASLRRRDHPGAGRPDPLHPGAGRGCRGTPQAPGPDPGRRGIGSSTTPASPRVGPRSATSSPSTPARRSTWAISGSKDLMDKERAGNNFPVCFGYTIRPTGEWSTREDGMDAYTPEVERVMKRLYDSLG